MDLIKTKYSIPFTLSLAIFLFITGCSTGSEEPLVVPHVLEVQIGDELVSFVNDELVVNENCDGIYVNTGTLTLNDERFRLEMDFTKTGRIKKVSFIDLSGRVGVEFKTADFLASEVFTINNFHWSESEQTLSFDFDGTLYEVDNPDNKKVISGTLRTDQLALTTCIAENWEIDATINNETFHRVSVDGRSTTTRDVDGVVVFFESVWTGYSDDGFRIALVMSDDLKNIEPGEYAFDESNQTDFIILEKYEGAYESVESSERNGAWQRFEYVGKFIIEEQLSSPIQVTQGSFNFLAFKDGELVYSVNNGTFLLKGSL